jgi:hypothetical protein
VRTVLTRGGLDGHFDAVILSLRGRRSEALRGDLPSGPRRAQDRPVHARIVGDSSQDDVGADLIGLRTLILPRTRGRSHGLGLVLRLVGRE